LDKKPEVIMGIDPGLANTGWGIVEARGSKLRPIAYGCISTDKRHDLPRRLAIIHDNLLEIIDRYLPRALSVEGIYFGENSKSAIPTAQARGAALVACAYRGLEYSEYTPMQIKQAVVGTGAADKQQVQYMVRAILGFDHTPEPDHAADALAAAITHARLSGVRELEREFAASTRKLDVPSEKETRSKFEARVQAALEKEEKEAARKGRRGNVTS
jgi:crossover junction endodeoxyribonuclease RuvC